MMEYCPFMGFGYDLSAPGIILIVAMLIYKLIKTEKTLAPWNPPTLKQKQIS
jgi:hypothetical protein